MQDKTTFGISDTFREFIEALVEEVVINGEPFDAQKKWLRKHSEAEGVNYSSLENNLEDLFQIIEEWRASQSRSSQIAMKTLARECYLSEEGMKKLLERNIVKRSLRIENDADFCTDNSIADSIVIPSEKNGQLESSICDRDHSLDNEKERAAIIAARKKKKEAERKRKAQMERAKVPLRIKDGIVYCTNTKYQGDLVVPKVLDNQSVLAIGEEVFMDCNGLISITIPDSVTIIGDKAFKGCGNLKRVAIPNSVTAIGNEAFRACNNLASIIIPNSVTSIGSEAFRGCFLYRTSIRIPDSVTYIGEGAFRGCSGLSTISISNALTEIEDGVFMNCGLTEIKIPDSVKAIGREAFLNCDAMLSLIIPNSVESIGNNAFLGCDNLEDVSVGEKYYHKLDNIPSSAQIHLISGNGTTIVENEGDGGGAHHHVDNRPFVIEGVRFNMVKVEKGVFQMGGRANSDESPVHQVTLSGYYIGETLVTQALWKAVMKTNPSGFKGDDLPVDSVSWNDCQEFIGQLNRMTGMSFRLPTEAEWEYAARGGSYSNGRSHSGSNNIDKVAWYDGNSFGKTHAVKSKSPNELGLYDMNGNVWEWCEDWYGAYTVSACVNPHGSPSGSGRVMRGGGWNSQVHVCRVSSRNANTPNNKRYLNGFRLCISEEMK